MTAERANKCTCDKVHNMLWKPIQMDTAFQNAPLQLQKNWRIASITFCYSWCCCLAKVNWASFSHTADSARCQFSSRFVLQFTWARATGQKMCQVREMMGKIGQLGVGIKWWERYETTVALLQHVPCSIIDTVAVRRIQPMFRNSAA